MPAASAAASGAPRHAVARVDREHDAVVDPRRLRPARPPRSRDTAAVLPDDHGARLDDACRAADRRRSRGRGRAAARPGSAARRPRRPAVEAVRAARASASVRSARLIGLLPSRRTRRAVHRARQPNMSGGSSIPCRSNFGRNAGPQPGRPELADDRAVRLDAVDVELEQVLERDRVALHPLHLGDRGHVPGAVVEPVELDDQVERRRDLLPDRAAPAARSRPSAPSSRGGSARRAASWRARSRASPRGPCSSPGACRAPRRRGPRRR